MPVRIHKFFIICLLTFPAGLLPLDSSASPWPEEFTAWYKTSKSIGSGETVVSIKPGEKNRYVYKSVTKASALMGMVNVEINEKSVWEYIDGKIRPLTYSYKRSNSKKRDAELTFDWKNKIVTNDIDSKPWKMSIKPDTLDKLVYQLAMMNDLHQGKKGELNYSIADGGKLKDFKILIIGEETIETELGKFTTTKVVRTRGTRTTTMWCAKKLGYLPVRITQKKEGGGEHTANIFKIEGFEGREP